MGLYLGGLIVGRIFASVIFFLGGGGEGLIIEILWYAEIATGNLKLTSCMNGSYLPCHANTKKIHLHELNYSTEFSYPVKVQENPLQTLRNMTA